MSFDRNSFEPDLLEVWAEETRLIIDIAEVCAAPDVTWVDDAAERTRRTQSLKAKINEVTRLQKTSEQLLQAMRLRSGLPERHQEAKENAERALTAAIEAVRKAEVRAEISKGSLLGLLKQNKQTQEMLGAYKQR